MTHSLIDESLDNERSLRESWVQQWGNAASEAGLERSTHFFKIPNLEGFVGYRIVSECAVTFGDPVCAKEDKPRFAQAFHRYCQEKNLTDVYIIASEQFAKWTIKNLSSVLLEVGEELIFDPQHDPTQGSRSSHLRNDIHHAQHVGLTFHEYLSHNANLEYSIDQVGAAWLKTRQGPQIYLVNLNFFESRMGKRWFYIQDNERVIAVALLSQLKAYQGWLLKFLVALPELPRGTTELMMTSILHTLRQENCRFLTYGIVPAESLGEIVGVGQFSAWLTRLAFKITKKIFHLERRKFYWRKFHPKTERAYLLFNKPKIGFQEIQAVLKALKIEF